VTSRAGFTSRRVAAATLVTMGIAAVVFAEGVRHGAPRRVAVAVPVEAAVVARAAVPSHAPARSRHVRMAPPATLTPIRPATADEARTATAPAPAAPELPPRRRPAARHAAPRVNAPLSVNAPPRSIQLLSVPVPNEIPAHDTVDWRVAPTGRAEILSPAAGTLAPSSAPRSVLVVTRVPADAPAGETHVATAQFDGGAGAVEVPVNLNVTRVRRADVRLVRMMYAARPGDRFSVDLQVVNRGNALDTVSVTAAIPDGWRIVRQPQDIVLRPGQQRPVQLVLQVPNNADPMRSYVRVQARAEHTSLAEATADVEILDPVLRGRHGPVLTAAVGSVLGDSVGASPVLSFDLSGSYDEHTVVSGHFAKAVNPGDVNGPGLSRVGMYLGQAYFNIASPVWQASVGATGRQFSPVSGLNAYGVGVSGGVDIQRWHAAALAAQPSSGNSGHLLGGEVGYRTSAGLVSVSATDFEELQSGFSRSLQTEGAAFVSQPIYDTRLSAATAWRQFAGGSGLGWAVQADRQGPRDFASLTVNHTPGGANAYAQATDQLTLAGSKQFSDRFNLHGSFSHGSDQNATFSTMSSQNWSLGSGYRLDPRSTVNVELNGDQYNSEDELGIGRGNRDIKATATLRTRLHRFDTELSVNGAQLTRPISYQGTTFDAPAAAQAGVSGSIGWVNAIGRFGASATYTYSGPQSGFFPNALAVGVSAGGVAVSSNPHFPTFDASVQRMEWFGSRSGATIIRVGTQIPIADAYRLSIDVERNPFLHAGSPSVPFVAAIKLERSLVLPFSHRSAAARGVVYEDLNGNGMRDAGEPGLGGVMVRRGGEVAISEPNGDFRLYDHDPRPAGIDATSLALGAVPGTPVTQANGSLDLPVVPTSSLEVVLAPAPDELGRSPTTKDFSSVVVVARDANGTVWTAQSDSTGHARLDALPPGRYTISADFSALNERLRVPGAAPMVEIRAGQVIPPVRLPVTLFTVKMFNAIGGNGTTLAKERK
jgi:hypothetical protein